MKRIGEAADLRALPKGHHEFWALNATSTPSSLPGLRSSACAAPTGRASRRCSRSSPARRRRPVGRYRIDGRVASLLELGAGFHMEFTGRANIIMNGVMMGISKREIEREGRRDHRVRRAGRLHRRAGAHLLLGHGPAPGLQRRRRRRPRRADHRRGLRGRRHVLPEEVRRQGLRVQEARTRPSSSAATASTTCASCATRPSGSTTARTCAQGDSVFGHQRVLRLPAPATSVTSSEILEESLPLPQDLRGREAQASLRGPEHRRRAHLPPGHRRGVLPSSRPATPSRSASGGRTRRPRDLSDPRRRRLHAPGHDHLRRHGHPLRRPDASRARSGLRDPAQVPEMQLLSGQFLVPVILLRRRGRAQVPGVPDAGEPDHPDEHEGRRARSSLDRTTGSSSTSWTPPPIKRGAGRGRAAPATPEAPSAEPPTEGCAEVTGTIRHRALRARRQLQLRRLRRRAASSPCWREWEGAGRDRAKLEVVLRRQRLAPGPGAVPGGRSSELGVDVVVRSRREPGLRRAA